MKNPAGLSSKGAISLWAIFLIFAALLFVAGTAGFFLLKSSLPQMPSYEIANFSGTPEVYSHKKRDWVPAERGSKFGPNDRIRTNDEKSGVDLRLPGQVALRLKGNSQFEGRERDLFNQELTHRFHLLRGTILAATQNNGTGHEKRFEISTPQVVAAVRGTIFKIQADPETQESSVQVLRGSVKVSSGSRYNPKVVIVQSLERTQRKGKGELMEPVRVSREQWDQMKEAYELTAKTAAREAVQTDLAKQGGTLFNYVFDHGAFYTPKIGYCSREFFRDEEGNVYLEIEYDVFPTGSFVGMYMKTRDLDLSAFEALEFEARRTPDERFPEAFRIELKSSGEVMRGLAFKGAEARALKNDWQLYSFPIRSSVATPLSEIDFVFLNSTVGEYKKGLIQIRNVNFIPSREGPKPPAKVIPENVVKKVSLEKSDAEKPETVAPKAPASQAVKVSLKTASTPTEESQ